VWLKKQGFRPAASANGGKRNLVEAYHLKQMGVSPGFPDVEVPLPSGHFHGFYLEMKRQKGGKVSPEQLEWLNYLRDKGYYAEVARGFEEAKEHFLHYLSFTKKAA
jgi:VRR-NUC domain-containing protein